MIRFTITFIALLGVLVSQLTTLGHLHGAEAANHSDKPHFHWLGSHAEHSTHDAGQPSGHSHDDKEKPRQDTPVSHDSDAIYLDQGSALGYLRTTSLEQLPSTTPAFIDCVVVAGNSNTDYPLSDGTVAVCIDHCPPYLRLLNLRI